MLAVSDGLHKSMAVPFYVIINSVNDEIPDLRLRNITVTLFYSPNLLSTSIIPACPFPVTASLDVVAQKVCYVHDNSHEASKDSFSYVCSTFTRNDLNQHVI
ncbi:hypothetical protein Y1Q_0020947 [Alligator mississippiensis]|uniref:Cadherin domain-containing protein n=1 Tax=Alligator mississippiensis TaxID=8496 RepID=A0A151NJH6_ALLMI|nr:hypothetical protein Y1Q_0020947 [Alligator mississippiensis]